jgi:MoaA/NifB/PqqE/SkfB family radical SAM enzyme
MEEGKKKKKFGWKPAERCWAMEMKTPSKKAFWAGRERCKYVRELLLEKINMSQVHSLVLALTNECNSKCRMCDIWEQARKKPEQLDIETIRKICAGKHMRGVGWVTLTGGEPFCRTDLEDIYLMVRRYFPAANITISSNGTLGDRIMAFFSAIDRVGKIELEVSLGAVGAPETGKAFEEVVLLADQLRTFHPGLAIKAKFVITPWNYGYIKDVAAWCRQRELSLCLKLVENSKFYTNSLRYKENDSSGRFDFSVAARQSIISDLKSLKKDRNVNGYHLGYLIDFLGRGEVKRRCFVARRMIFVNYDASVYSCRNRTAIGNASREDLDKMVADRGHGDFRQSANDAECRKCISLFRFLF